MRKLAIAAVLGLVVCLVAGGATLAAADRGHAQGHGQGQKAFTVFALTPPNGFTVIPVTAGKVSLGDRFVGSDDLLTAKGGRALGTDGIECTLVRITDAATQSADLQCLVTFSLPDGQIATQALNHLTNGGFNGTQTGAITGGTGKYRNAKGQFSVEFLSQTEANVTFFVNH